MTNPARDLDLTSMTWVDSHQTLERLRPALTDLLDAIESIELLDEGTTGWLMPLLAARDRVAACPDRRRIVTTSKHAVISEDGRYRYALTRTWEVGVWSLAFIMLNPSTADAEVDDPTIRRCMGFARDMGYGGITVANLYAYRATNPADLWKTNDPVGPDNDEILRGLLFDRAMADVPVIAAWGANARPDRVADVLAMPGADRLEVLGLTKAGAPRHPLYLRADARPTRWKDAS